MFAKTDFATTLAGGNLMNGARSCQRGEGTYGEILPLLTAIWHLFRWAGPAAMPETLMVGDRHGNGALVVLQDEPFTLREFQVSLRGPEFDDSLFQYLKF